MDRSFFARAVVLLFALNAPAPAEIFVLQQGGQIEGELQNPDEVRRETYVIKTPCGATVTLQRAQVKQIIRQRPVEIEYEKIRPDYADTVDGQWKLAEWCRDHNLMAQRRTHLERIVELEPNHAQARRALGFSQVGGKWTTQKEAMEEQGLEWHKGRYRTKQEIEILEQKEKQNAVEKEWAEKIKRWQTWLAGDKARIGKECIEAINDPAAVKGLMQGMKSNSNPEARTLLVSALARIGTVEAERSLAFIAVEDPVDEVRLTALDHLKEKKNPAAVDFFVGHLHAKDNRYVNRAGVALGQMGDPSAIAPLIDALVTAHKFKVHTGQGQQSATFGTGPGGAPGGGGMTMGGSPIKIYTEYLQNRDVLDALTQLTGVNYGFDIRAWKSWFTLQRKRDTVDARRGT